MGSVVQSGALLEPHLFTWDFFTWDLVPVLPGWELSARSMHVVRCAEVNSFVEFVVERLG